jgi:hypothetical protein
MACPGAALKSSITAIALAQGQGKLYSIFSASFKEISSHFWAGL